MFNVSEQVSAHLTQEQNLALEASFKEFYKLDSAPKIKRSLLVEKSEYNKFLKSRTKLRTQFESAPSGMDLSFDSFRTPFTWVASTTDFTLLSGKTINLYEQLDSPNGLTEKVIASHDDKKIEFPSYFQAEGYVLAEFLKEKH